MVVIAAEAVTCPLLGQYRDEYLRDGGHSRKPSSSKSKTTTTSVQTTTSSVVTPTAMFHHLLATAFICKDHHDICRYHHHHCCYYDRKRACPLARASPQTAFAAATAASGRSGAPSDSAARVVGDQGKRQEVKLSRFFHQGLCKVEFMEFHLTGNWVSLSSRAGREQHTFHSGE